jgi:hypothetical protein
MKYLLVYLLYVAGQPEPSVDVQLSFLSRTMCDKLAADNAWTKNALGPGDDGKVVLRITAQCVPVLDEDIDHLKKSVR